MFTEFFALQLYNECIFYLEISLSCLSTMLSKIFVRVDLFLDNYCMLEITADIFCLLQAFVAYFHTIVLCWKKM